MAMFWTALASLSGRLVSACWVAEAAVQHATDTAMALDYIARRGCR